MYEDYTNHRDSFNTNSSRQCWFTQDMAGHRKGFVMVCVWMSAQSLMQSWEVSFSEVIKYGMCDVGIKGMWLVNQPNDWTGIVLARIKIEDATPTPDFLPAYNMGDNHSLISISCLLYCILVTVNCFSAIPPCLRTS